MVRAWWPCSQGLPAGLRIDFDYVNRELKRRQGGYGRGGRMKIETDTAQFLSGVQAWPDHRFAHRHPGCESGLGKLERGDGGGRPAGITGQIQAAFPAAARATPIWRDA